MSRSILSNTYTEIGRVHRDTKHGIEEKHFTEFVCQQLTVMKLVKPVNTNWDRNTLGSKRVESENVIQSDIYAS